MNLYYLEVLNVEQEKVLEGTKKQTQKITKI